MNYEQALRLFADHGNIAQDVEKLRRKNATEAQLESAVQQVIAKARLAALVILEEQRRKEVGCILDHCPHIGECKAVGGCVLNRT